VTLDVTDAPRLAAVLAGARKQVAEIQAVAFGIRAGRGLVRRLRSLTENAGTEAKNQEREQPLHPHELSHRRTFLVVCGVPLVSLTSVADEVSS
jgi:hypothetical protein